MGKDSGILWAIGGAAALWFLTSGKAQAQNGGGLLPDINIPEIKIPDINIPDIILPAIDLPDVEVNFPSWSELFGGGDNVEANSEQPTPDTIIDESQPPPDLGPLRQKAGRIAGIGTGLVTAVGTARIVPLATRAATGAAVAIAPRLAATTAARVGLKFVPVIGWGYLAADVGATIYELVSGKSIGGDWLGWGEMIRDIF